MKSKYLGNKMYKIIDVHIKGFWNKLEIYTRFNDDVNIIIGRNGTGKTTFMNLLYSALSVDVDGLIDNEFTLISIKLSYRNDVKLIHIEKLIDEADDMGYSILYTIDREIYHFKAMSLHKSKSYGSSGSIKRRMFEQTNELREILGKYIALSSLSVYRLRSNEEIEIHYRSSNKIISPVDYRLSQLENEFIQYQFELSKKAREISFELQKDVLSSILYSEKKMPNRYNIPRTFNKKQEKYKLLSAYERLGIIDSNIKQKIDTHINSVDKAVKVFNNIDSQITADFSALDAYFRTQTIIDMSLKADSIVNQVFSPIDLFLDIIRDFIVDKKFVVETGQLKVFNKYNEEIEISKLSSGEKQLLILFIETLLQKAKPYVYLTDEPELSLHIDWQRRIIPAVKKLNPSAQIIVATHSPEVASKYRQYIVNMEDMCFE